MRFQLGTWSRHRQTMHPHIECNKSLPIIPDALQAIHHAGGHFVLCLDDKRPVWRSWQKLRPGLDVVLAHPGPLGHQAVVAQLVTALDVDTGDPGELMRGLAAHGHPQFPPVRLAGTCTTQTPKGRGNGHFEVYGCAGEIRSAKGYLILWHDGAGRLADALRDPVARSCRWPRDLFELAGLPAVTLQGAVKTPAYSYKPSDQSRQTWAAAAAAVELETIKRGRRNVKLFDAVRFWAYSVPRGQELEAWTRRVRVHALEQNRRFPEPLEESEVKQTAYSISTWCWSGGGAKWHFDHSSAAQRRRGVKSGKVRRARNRARDTAWRAAHAAGQSMRSIAKEYGVEPSTVFRVLREPNQLALGGAGGIGGQLRLL